MLKVNTTIFDLDTLLEHKYADILNITKTLLEVKDELEERKKEFSETEFDEDNSEELETIDKQMYYLNRNIMSLKTTLTYHENRVINQFDNLGDLKNVCFN